MLKIEKESLEQASMENNNRVKNATQNNTALQRQVVMLQEKLNIQKGKYEGKLEKYKVMIDHLRTNIKNTEDMIEQNIAMEQVWMHFFIDCSLRRI